MSIQSNINQMMNTLALSTFGVKKGFEEHKAGVAEKQLEDIKKSRALNPGDKEPDEVAEQAMQYYEDRLQRGIPTPKKSIGNTGVTVLDLLKEGTPADFARALKESISRNNVAMRQDEIYAQRQATFQNLLNARINQKGGNK